MYWVQVCPTPPISGVCPEPLIWVETASNLGLTLDEFWVILPALVGALLGAKLIRMALKNFFPNF